MNLQAVPLHLGTFKVVMTSTVFHKDVLSHLINSFPSRVKSLPG